jgi:hypothetical protein
MGVPEKSGIPFYPRNTTRNRGLPTKLIVMENIGIFTDEMARSIYVFPTPADYSKGEGSKYRLRDRVQRSLKIKNALLYQNLGFSKRK